MLPATLGEGETEDGKGTSAKGCGRAATAGQKSAPCKTVGSGKECDPNNFANDPARCRGRARAAIQAATAEAKAGSSASRTRQANEQGAAVRGRFHAAPLLRRGPGRPA